MLQYVFAHCVNVYIQHPSYLCIFEILLYHHIFYTMYHVLYSYFTVINGKSRMVKVEEYF